MAKSAAPVDLKQIRASDYNQLNSRKIILAGYFCNFSTVTLLFKLPGKLKNILIVTFNHNISSSLVFPLFLCAG